MITIYTPYITARVQYIVHHIFQDMLGIDCQILDEKEPFLKQSGCCINYSHANLNKGLWIHPHSLLSETEIKEQIIEMDTWHSFPCFFLQKKGDIPFDIFAASFYLITRYEEYIDDRVDKHGRYVAENSLAYKEDFLQTPLVDRWVAELKKLLSFDENAINYEPRTFRLISTFDVDHPFLYRNKGIIKNLVGGIINLARGNFNGLKERVLTQLHLCEDPYIQALKNIDQLHLQQDKEYFIFVLMGKYGKNDRRTIYPMRKYYKYLQSLFNVRFGLHPSYQASFDVNLIKEEKASLEKILNCEIKRNRQHFLRMKFPNTYKGLDTLDFIEDFTLVYPSQPGFRASTSIPFHFFDLTSNQSTFLLVRPTICMDVTFISYLSLSPGESLRKIKKLAMECYISGGDFTMLWHNSTLSGGDNNLWYKVFTESFLYALSLEK